MNDRILNTQVETKEQEFEASLRPVSLSEYVGQDKVCEQMDIFISAAKKRDEALDHVLIFGSAGLGKTTLALIIANEMGVNLRQTSGPILEKAADLAAMLTSLEEKDVLFIDEIHRLSPAIEEVLYPALEDFRLDIMIGEGPAARSIQIDLPQFTLVGATTRAGLLTSPLRDRFGIVQRLNFYTTSQLAEIIRRSSKILNIKVDKGGSEEIAKRSRGTPRIANRLLKRSRDYADIKENGEVNTQVSSDALDMLGVDVRGLDEIDRQYLLVIIERFSGGPVGLNYIAAALNEEQDTIEDVIEPFLIQQGFVIRTPRGRAVTKSSYAYFDKKVPVDVQKSFAYDNQD